MWFFGKKEESEEIRETQCIGCKCANCRFMKYGSCDFHYNECKTTKIKTCKISSCDNYKK